MTKLLVLAFMTIILLVPAPLAYAQKYDWRFGFEDTWAHFAGLMTADTQKEALLAKLEIIAQAQKAGGDININGLTDSWNKMQPTSDSPLDFSESDRLVQLLQKHGFSMLWTVRVNSEWASTINPDCWDHSSASDCAPDLAHEDDLYNYIYAIVERYDGDGLMDMGYETPDDTTDDLKIPIQNYSMIGEIEFVGASPPPQPGYGDATHNHFWTDSIENLLRTHRIVYQAVHDADPNSKLVGSGGILWDLYSDFPDYPKIEGPTIQARLEGDNNHNAFYVESFNRLKQLLSSYGDDSDGIECDYIGWHPHMPWRGIEQTFSFIKTYAGHKPIYIEDMWCNIFPVDRADAPGNTLFTGGGQAVEGDFPNSLIPSYTALKDGILFNNLRVLNWYYAKHARTIVKAFVSVFGEGAKKACISGISDIQLDRLGIMGTLEQNFFEKPGYYTYKLLVEKLHDFTTASEIKVSADPHTRVYEFNRPRGPVYVLWSEMGDAPPNLDYRSPSGETVTLKVKNNVEQLKLTHIVTNTLNTLPDVEIISAQNGLLTIQLGYEPIFLEGAFLADAGFMSNEGDGIDVVLAMDRSASMSGDNKIENAKIAANTFVGFMQIGDTIGLVSFNDSAHTDFSLTTIVSEETKREVQFAVDSINTDGFTSIGAAIQFGQMELNKGDPNHLHAMLLLSDGKENTPPFVADVLPTMPAATDIYAIGLGWNVDGALLNRIAAATYGTYNFTPSPEELQHIYLLLRARILGQQILSNFTGIISQRETQSHTVTIDALTSLATFSITFQSGDVDLEMVTPSGTIIDPQVATSDPDISYTEGSTYDYYTIGWPEAGAWELQILGVDVNSFESYSATVQVYSDLKTKVSLDKNEYNAGWPILVTANLAENGQPILDAKVTADVKLPTISTFAVQNSKYLRSTSQDFS